MEKSYRKCAPKASPRPLQKQLLHARNYFKYKILWKIFHQKALKKLTLFCLSNTVPFNGRKGPGTSEQSPFRLPDKIRKVSLLEIYYLTKFDDVI